MSLLVVFLLLTNIAAVVYADQEESKGNNQERENNQEKIREVKQERLDKLEEIKQDRLGKITGLNKEKLEKLADLDEKQLNKLANLDRARANELAKKAPKMIREQLAKLKMKNVSKDDLFKERAIGLDKAEHAREKYAELKEMHKEISDELKEERDAFKDAVDSKNETATIEHAKAYLNRVADLVLNNLESIKANAEANDDLTEDEATEIIAELDEKIVVITDAKSAIDAAQTKDEVKKAGKVIINSWKRMEEKVKLHAGRIIKSNVMDVLKRAEQLERRLDRTLARLEEKGYNISTVDNLTNDFSENIDGARELLRTASSKFSKARGLTSSNSTQEEINVLVNEGKELVKQAHDELKEAHKIFVDIMKQVKDLTGKTELDDTEDVVEVIEDYDDDGNQNDEGDE